MESTIVQVSLKSYRDEIMTTWVDKRPDLKVGAVISLKDIPYTYWRVMALYPQEHSAQDFTWHRKWTNNI